MIDSIVELPEYIPSDAKVDLNGQRVCNLFSGLGDDLMHLRVDGRILHVPSTWKKYKIQMTDYLVNRIYTIVGICPASVDLRRPYPDRDCMIEFIPLYVREYSRNGAVRGKNGNLFIWVPGVNRFLEKMCLPPVCSLAAAFEHVMSLGAVQEFCYIPDAIKDRKLDTRFATVAPYPDDVIITLIDGSCWSATGILSQAVDDCCVYEGYFSDKLMAILFMERFGQLNRFIDPHHQDSVISNCINQSTKDWGIWYEWVHKTDDECPRYLSHDRDESIAMLLHCASLIPTPDFHIECEPSEIAPKVTKGFNPFTFEESRIDKFHITNKVRQCVSSLVCGDYFRNTSSYHVNGSYLEEILIYNYDGELVNYIDQVWWILATGYGLLNQASVYI